jgi:hypothetical protein
MRATQFVCYSKMGCPDKPGNDGVKVFLFKRSRFNRADAPRHLQSD